jgi:hypothetical protein
VKYVVDPAQLRDDELRCAIRRDSLNAVDHVRIIAAAGIAADVGGPPQQARAGVIVQSCGRAELAGLPQDTENRFAAEGILH